jgi:Tol biopolymer transport system component
VLHILDRALEKDPEDRYQTMRDMVIDLRRAKRETSRVSRSAIASPAAEQGRVAALDEQKVTAGHVLPAAGKRRVSHRVAIWIGLAGALIAIVVIAVFMVEHKRPPSLNPDLSFRPLQIPFSQIESVGLSRDGGWLAFDVRDANDLCSVYFMNVAKGNPQRLTTEPYRWIFNTDVSPDGSDVLYDGMLGVHPSAVLIVSSLGGASRRIAEPGRYARWRPDGQLIGYIRDGTHRTPSGSGRREFWTVRPDGSENHLEFIDSLSYVYAGIGFDWSPDGKSIAWLRSSPDYNEIFIRDLKSVAERQLTGFKMPIYEIAWASNNQIFFSFAKSGSMNIWMIPARGGEAVQVTKGAGPDYGARVSCDSKRLLYLQAREIRHIWTGDIDGRNARQLTFDNQYLGAPSFSPDRKKISYYMDSEDILHPTCHVFTMDSDGSNRTQVTSGDAAYFNAAWSPDGKHIAYGSYRMNEPIDSSRVYVIEASNPGTPRLIGKGISVLWISAEELIASIVPHRQSIRYALHKSGPLQMSQDSTLEYPLHDGTYALVWDYRAGRRGWWVKRTAPGENEPPKLLVPEEYLISSWPSVSLRYLLSRQANAEVWRISLPDGRRERLPDFLNGRNPFYDEVQMSYDDKSLVYVTGQIDAKLVLIDNLFK